MQEAALGGFGLNYFLVSLLLEVIVVVFVIQFWYQKIFTFHLLLRLLYHYLLNCMTILPARCNRNVTVAAMGRQIEPVAGLRDARFHLTIDQQPGRTGDQQDPFAFGLVVPVPWATRLSGGDNALDSHARCFQ